MIAICVRNQEAFELVSPHLDSGHLYLQNPAYSVVWVALEGYFHDYQSMPDQALMTVMVAQVMEEDMFSTLLSTEQTEEVLRLVDMAYDESTYGDDVSTSSTKVRFAATTAKALLIRIEQNRLESSIKDRSKLNELPAMLHRSAEKISSLDAMLTKPSSVVFPEGWEKNIKLVLTPSGIEVVDRFLGGGGAEGEVIAILAPFGSCKTTTAVQSVVAIAKMCRVEYRAACDEARQKRLAVESVPVPVVIYATYETPVKEFQQRCLGFASQIPKDRIEAMEDYSSLRTSGEEPLPYELTEFADLVAQGIPIPSEVDRVRNTTVMINKHVVLLDMTGSDPERQHIGSLGVEELAANIKQELKHRNATLRALWLDHISAMVDYQMARTGGDDKDKNTAIMRAPQSVRKMIGGPLKAPCFVVHQLAGEAGGKSATHKFDMSNSSGSKSFAQYLDFMIVATKPNENQICLFQCVKHRRKPPTANRLVLVDGNFNRVRDVSDIYVIDETTRTIVSRNEIEAVAAALPAERRRPQTNTMI